MDFRLMTVATMTHKTQAKILITGSLLERFGFVPETIVTVFSENGQLILSAQGTGLDCYKQVVGEVRKRRGHLIQIFSWKRKKIETHLVLEGAWLERQGFAIGNPILVRFEPGLIRINHIPLSEMGFSTLPGATYRISTVQHQKHIPLIQFKAKWLQDYNFLPGQTVSVSYESGFLTLNCCSDNQIRQVNIWSKNNVPYLRIAGLWLLDCDYHPGDILIVQCHENQLVIRRFEEHYLYF